MRDTTLERLTPNRSPGLPAMDADESRVTQRNRPAAKIDFERYLVEMVGRALCATRYPALRHIQIEIEQGTVTLWGSVPTYHQKQLAQATAQKVDGVRGIANGIAVVSCR